MLYLERKYILKQNVLSMIIVFCYNIYHSIYDTVSSPTSNVYSLVIGRFIIPPSVRMFATRPSLPWMSASILANFHHDRGPSSCTMTMSPTLIVCSLRPEIRWFSRKAVRYSLLHLQRKSSMSFCCICAPLEMFSLVMIF